MGEKTNVIETNYIFQSVGPTYEGLKIIQNNYTFLNYQTLKKKPLLFMGMVSTWSISFFLKEKLNDQFDERFTFILLIIDGLNFILK